MGFKSNWKEASQPSGIKPEGDYECLIQKIEERTTRNGAVGLNISMVIRNDVQQNYKNAFIFYTLWKRREPTEADLSVNGYSFGQVMALGKAAGLPDGKDYDNLEQFCQELTGKPLLITLKHREYNGKTLEDVNRLAPTKFPEVRHTYKQSVTENTYAAPQQSYAAPAATQQGFNDMPTDDDLPF